MGICILTLQMRTLRPEEVNRLAQGHTVTTGWGGTRSHPSSLITGPFSRYLHATAHPFDIQQVFVIS